MRATASSTRSTWTAGPRWRPLTGVAPGAHDYRATFVPADAVSFLGAVSTVTTATVAPIATATALAAAAAGRTVTLDAEVTSSYAAPAGEVVFRDGSGVVGRDRRRRRHRVDGAERRRAGRARLHRDVRPRRPRAPRRLRLGARTVTVAAIATETALTADVSVRTVTLDAQVTADSGTPVRRGRVPRGHRRRGHRAPSRTAPRPGADAPSPPASTPTPRPSCPADAVTFGGSVSPERTVTVAPIVTETDARRADRRRPHRHPGRAGERRQRDTGRRGRVPRRRRRRRHRRRRGRRRVPGAERRRPGQAHLHRDLRPADDDHLRRVRLTGAHRHGRPDRHGDRPGDARGRADRHPRRRGRRRQRDARRRGRLPRGRRRRRAPSPSRTAPRRWS